MTREAIAAWYDSLNEAERFAVHYWLFTGSTVFIVQFLESSDRLRLFPFVAFEKSPIERFKQRVSSNLRT